VVSISHVERSQDDAELLRQTRDKLKEVLDTMRDPTARATPSETPDPNKPRLHSHLQDLGPEDLPEESRGLITREIAFFRERAAKKEADRMQQEQERERNNSFERNSGSFASQGGRGAFGAGRGRTGSPQVNNQRYNQAAHAQGSPTSDPQGYNKPVGFVRAGERAGSPPRGYQATDEEFESQRQERRKREAEMAYRDVRHDSIPFSSLCILLTHRQYSASDVGKIGSVHGVTLSSGNVPLRPTRRITRTAYA
jgi:RNA-binding protein 25